MKLMGDYLITNASSGFTFATISAFSEREALSIWLGQLGEAHLGIVQCGKQRPYITGDDEPCYIATLVTG